MPNPRGHYSPPQDDDGDDSIEADFANDLTKCPACRELIYDDADRCPYCGKFIASASTGGKPRWVVITGWVLIGGLLILILVSAARGWKGW